MTHSSHSVSPFHWTLMLAVGAGGAIGALLRYLVIQIIPMSEGGFPWGTLACNITGSFVLAYLAVKQMNKKRFPLSPVWTVAIMTGVIGSFTTFSTVAFEMQYLVRMKSIMALTYLAASAGLGLIAALSGHFVAARRSAE
ncbi:fluoride efflux transporter FluC [Marinicrinis sediminis]|uniref:Fluoride-specific ion channel FluC n=1 Tax=Marinicrinis sediminis TaxID=1652465 RepID=A0ABW5R661_9BACL